MFRLRVLSCWTSALLGGVGLCAEPEAVRKSPFLPPQQTMAAPITENAPIEFRGVIVLGGRQQFNFIERGKNKSTWVLRDDNATGFLVRSYDEANDVVKVEYEGRALTLTLEKPKIGSAPIAAAPVATPAAATVANAAPPASTPVVLNPTPADEAKRLDSIAAEVRRRRALRQQGTGTVTPTTQ